MIVIFYPIIPYQRIKVYRVETIDMGRLCCKNGVSGKLNTSKQCGIYCTGQEPSGMIHRFLDNDTLRKHR